MTERSLQRFDVMQQQGLLPNVIIDSSLISPCGMCRMMDMSLQFFDEMRRQGL